MTPNGREPSRETFRYIVEGVAKPGEIGPKHFEDIHRIDESNGSRLAWLLADVFLDELEIESVDIVTEESRLSGEIR